MKAFPSFTAMYRGTTLCGLMLFCGCIHPNLPSVRYDNQPPPVLEEVGFFGAADDEARIQTLHQSPVPGQPFLPRHEIFSHEQGFAQPEYCEGDGYLTNRGHSHQQPDTPEAPWPRFHPLPTRPVLGNGG